MDHRLTDSTLLRQLTALNNIQWTLVFWFYAHWLEHGWFFSVGIQRGLPGAQKKEYLQVPAKITTERKAMLKIAIPRSWRFSAATLIMKSIKCHHIDRHHQLGDGEQGPEQHRRARRCPRPRCPRRPPACQCPWSLAPEMWMRFIWQKNISTKQRSPGRSASGFLAAP